MAGLAFLIAGAFGLWSISAELAGGAYPAGSVVAVTHLFTLGWITTSIMGALYQFLPVALNQPIASERFGHVTFVLHVTGVVLMVTGIGLHRAAVLTAGLTLLGVAIAVFVTNLTVTLKRAARRELTWWALCFAEAFLTVALLAGIALAINRFTFALGSAHDLALRVHMHAALYGWVLLVIVGVSHRLLPMFLLSHGGGDRFAWWAVWLLAAGAGIATLFHHVPLLGRELPLAVLAAGVIAWVAQTRIFFRKRHRPHLDPGLRLSAVAIVVLAIAPLALARLAFPGAGAASRTFYAAVLVMGSALFVAAQYYKIVPFLIWHSYFGPLAGSRPLPRVADLYTANRANIAIALLAAGTAFTLAGIALATGGVVRVGAALLALGALAEAHQLWDVSRRRP